MSLYDTHTAQRGSFSLPADSESWNPQTGNRVNQPLFALNEEGTILAASLPDGSMKLYQLSGNAVAHKATLRESTPEETRFLRFEGGFCNDEFFFSAAVTGEIQYFNGGLYHLWKFDWSDFLPRPDVVLNNYEEIHVQADDNGIYVSVGGSLRYYDKDMESWIYCALLKDHEEFWGFFQYVGFSEVPPDLPFLIRTLFRGKVCENADIPALMEHSPVELAYALALIGANDKYSITPPWVLKTFPVVGNVLKLLRNTPCRKGCAYCRKALDIHKALRETFNFSEFRTYNGEPLQENAARAAVDGKSLLAVFPTGGGKSVTFQLPALMAGKAAHALTVVISPLQSLMKDQVDNLGEKGIVDAVTINGMLRPMERAEALERVASGMMSLPYISPELLRSRTLEALLLSRHIARFVIDEAHCFSAWGQDFRVDYLFIGDFIRELQRKKADNAVIPVSCFTATVKQKVISDIRDYFKRKLDLDLELYASDAERENLRPVRLKISYLYFHGTRRKDRKSVLMYP